MEGTQTYSPRDVSVVIGKYTIDVFQSVTVAQAEDRVSHKAAATGEVTRTISHNPIGTITLVLPQTTPKNSTLQSIHNQIMDGYKRGLFATVTIKDKLGDSVHILKEASIKKSADAAYEKDASDRTWVFEGTLQKHENKGSGLSGVPM